MDHDQRLLVGLAGIPASGKSTFARTVVDECNRILSLDSEHKAIVVGLDGWHLTRAQLDAFPDAKLAHDRRGAHWTFDGDAYVDFVQELRKPISTSKRPIKAPSFDHALKDPTPHSVEIFPHHRIIVIEGLYTFLSIEPWKRAGEQLDERWFIDISVQDASNRLVKRHVLTGVANDMDEAVWRARENDMPSECPFMLVWGVLYLPSCCRWPVYC